MAFFFLWLLANTYLVKRKKQHGFRLRRKGLKNNLEICTDFCLHVKAFVFLIFLYLGKWIIVQTQNAVWCCVICFGSTVAFLVWFVDIGLCTNHPSDGIATALMYAQSLCCVKNQEWFVLTTSRNWAWFGLYQ